MFDDTRGYQGEVNEKNIKQLYGALLYTLYGIQYLVGGLGHFLFFHILGTIIPTDFHISEGLKPPAR